MLSCYAPPAVCTAKVPDLRPARCRPHRVCRQQVIRFSELLRFSDRGKHCHVSFIRLQACHQDAGIREGDAGDEVAQMAEYVLPATTLSIPFGDV